MPNGPRKLTGSEIVDIAKKLANEAINGGVNPQVVLLKLVDSLITFKLDAPPMELWLRIVQAVDAGISKIAGFGSDAVARLVDAVGQQLPGNDELNQLAYSLGHGAPSNPSGTRCIFLSYSSIDRHEVDKLYTALVKVDPTLNVFQDHRSIALGRDWLDVIRTAAGNAAIMACWLTGNYLNSTFCHYEVGISDSLGAKIISIQDANHTLKTPAYISQRQALTCSRPINYDNIAQELIKAF